MDMPPLVDRNDWEFTARPDGLPGPWPAIPPSSPAWPGAAAGGFGQPGGWGAANPPVWGPAPGVMMAGAMPAAPAFAAFPPVAPPGNAYSAPNDEWARGGMAGPATPFRTPPVRSHSPYPDSPRSEVSVSRSRSFTSSIRERHKRPPREWRANFSMVRPSTLESAFDSIFRSRSLSRSDSASLPRASLSQYLRYTSRYSPMALDLREHPYSVKLHELNRPTSVEWDLIRYACEPPLPGMTLVNEHFPWVIEVMASNPTGVTLHDLFMAIWNCMITQITFADWYNVEIDDVARGEVTEAFYARVRDNPMERNAGIRRVDFLRGRVMMRGLKRLRDGTFEMKLTYPNL